MDEEILEALRENPFHHQKESVAPSLDEIDWDQEWEVQIPDLDNENKKINVNCFKAHFSPLYEDEIDQLLKIML